jgi:hypothetical protein
VRLLFGAWSIRNGWSHSLSGSSEPSLPHTKRVERRAGAFAISSTGRGWVIRFAQSCFEICVRDGQVEVRARD